VIASFEGLDRDFVFLGREKEGGEGRVVSGQEFIFYGQVVHA